MAVPLASKVRAVFLGIGFLAAFAVDRATPLGVADWLIPVLLVWVSSLSGGRRELTVVAVAASAAVAFGFWSSRGSLLPIWGTVINRLMTIVLIWIIVEVTRRRRIAEEIAERAMAEIRVLQGLLPICANCKAIRTPAGEWQQLERYIATHSEATFTHTLCSECVPKFLDLNA